MSPGIAGVSHNIHVRSIIGCVLKPTRLFCSHYGGGEQMSYVLYRFQQPLIKRASLERPE
ncbi:hypothetical protein G7025_06400 [Pseudomonas lurida]|nr:hypothetical protein [Pseudomonas lurida]